MRQKGTVTPRKGPLGHGSNPVILALAEALCVLQKLPLQARCVFGFI
jgi:hypothetical protein